MMICRLVVDIILNILGISTIHAYFFVFENGMYDMVLQTCGYGVGI